MDADQKALEERKLRLQVLHIFVTAITTVLTVVGALLVAQWTIGAELTARAREQAREEKQQTNIQQARTLAETGEAGCDLSAEFSTEISDLKENLFSDVYPVTFCERFLELPPSVPVQRELIAQLAEHPRQQEQILAMWRAVYDAEAWIDRIEAALEK